MSVPADIEKLLHPLLPAGAAVSAARSVPPPADWPARFPEEAARMADATGARRAEFFTGRECGRSCLAALGLPAGPLPSDDAGLPRWPEGAAGSITHSRGLCLAVAAHSNRCASIGVDLERTGRMSAAAARRVLHPVERAFAEGDRDRATLLFSLKEAFFKCQFPAFGAHPGFRDVAFAMDEGGASARVVWSAATLPEEPRDAAGRMNFRFVFADGWVASLAWLPAA